MSSLPKAPDWVTNKTQAIVYLEFAQQTYENAQHTRIHAIITARNLGLTFSEIGSAINMTQSGVRMMLKRAGEK